jgi:hypothetical protein
MKAEQAENKDEIAFKRQSPLLKQERALKICEEKKSQMKDILSQYYWLNVKPT